ncbi:hypothetical protein GEMRC1_002987 [Eukaryota sp. GEM-RC1]
MKSSKEPPLFRFQPRNLPVDWHLFSSIDLSSVISNQDVSSLQRLITPITFANVSEDPAFSFLDKRLLTFIQSAQLIIEYLVFSQQQLVRRNQLLQAWSTPKLTPTTQKSTQTQPLPTLPHSPFSTTPVTSSTTPIRSAYPASKCHICGKVFVSASYLSSHMARRHSTSPHPSMDFSRIPPSPGEFNITSSPFNFSPQFNSLRTPRDQDQEPKSSSVDESSIQMLLKEMQELRRNLDYKNSGESALETRVVVIKGGAF